MKYQNKLRLNTSLVIIFIITDYACSCQIYKYITGVSSHLCFLIIFLLLMQLQLSLLHLSISIFREEGRTVNTAIWTPFLPSVGDVKNQQMIKLSTLSGLSGTLNVLHARSRIDQIDLHWMSENFTSMPKSRLIIFYIIYWLQKSFMTFLKKAYRKFNCI